MNKRVLYTASSLLLSGLLASSTAHAQTSLGIWDLYNQDAPATNNLIVQDLDMPYDSVVWGVQQILQGANNQDVFVTQDRGQNWNYNTITGGGANQYNLSTVSAINGNIAYLSAFNPTSTATSNGRLYKTVDGAQTFVRVTSLPAVNFLNFVHFFTPDIGVVMSDPDGQGFQLFRTADAGVTWTRLTTVPQPTGTDFGIVNLFYAMGDRLWFITANGEVVRTADKGLTWAKSATGLSSSTEQVLRRIAFANDQVGIVVGSDSAQYARTTDGGATWNQFTPNGTFLDYGICGVPMATTPTFVGVDARVGATGTSISTDGGLNWAVVDTLAPLLEPHFWDGRTGWAGSFTFTNAGVPIGGMFEYAGPNLGPVRANPVINVQAPSIALSSLNLTGTVLDLGPATVGTPVTAILTITNNGNAPLNITGMTSSNAAFTATPTTGTIAPGATLTVTITYTAVGSGLASSNLTITSNAQNLPSAVISLRATGVLGLGQDAALASLAQVFPNPANTTSAATLRLTGDLTLTGAVTLTDALGRTVQRLAAPAGATEVQVGGNLAAGVYTLRAETSRGALARCLVVK